MALRLLHRLGPFSLARFSSGSSSAQSSVASTLSTAPLAASATSAAASSSENVAVSDACAQRIHAINKRSPEKGHRFLRVAVEPGGCGGFTYQFTLTKDVQPTDKVFEKNGATVIIDDVSLPLLSGSTITYEETLMSSSFVVQSNPQSVSSCSCKTSFTLKDPSQ